MNIYKSEKQDFKSKDELLKEVIRDRFDECADDFSGDIEAVDPINLAIHYGYFDLAKEMRSDFNLNKCRPIEDERPIDEELFYQVNRKPCEN